MSMTAFVDYSRGLLPSGCDSALQGTRHLDSSSHIAVDGSSGGACLCANHSRTVQLVMAEGLVGYLWLYSESSSAFLAWGERLLQRPVKQTALGVCLLLRQRLLSQIQKALHSY
jgi:hypothetical protein